MKYYIACLALLINIAFCFSQTKKIKFETSTFAEIKAKAKKENKLIFMDAYTSWCGPCKWMAANTFTNDSVADYFNQKYINAKFDMEKGEGIDLAKQYNVQCYPNLLFIDGDGNMVHRSAGGMAPAQFMQFAKDASNPDKQFSALQKQYEAKKTDAAFLYDYLNIISTTCLDFDVVSKDYFATQKDEDLSNRKNWEVIKHYSSDYKSKEFVYLLNNLDLFKQKYTADSVYDKIYATLTNSGFNVIYQKESTEADYQNYRNEISKINFGALEKTLFTLDMAFYEKTKNWEKYINLAVEQGDKYYTQPEELNNISWSIYEKTDDKKALLKAEEWMKKVVIEQPNYYNLDTYAAILYKLGKKSEAKDAALKSIEAAKNDGMSKDDYKATSELLEKIGKLK